MKAAKVGLLALWVYLSFIGGGSYQDLNIVILIGQHLLLSLVLGAWIIGLLRRGEAWPATPLDAPLLALVGWWWVSAAFSRDWRVSLEQTWLLLMHVGLVYWLVGWMRQGRQRWIMEAVFLVAALVVVVSAAEWLSWYFGLGFGGNGAGWWPIGGLDDPTPPFWHRVGLAMNVATWLGNYIVLTLPLTLAWAASAHRREDRQALWLLSAGLVGVLWLTQSRGGFLGLAAAASAALVLWQVHQRGLTFSGQGWRWAQAGAALLLIVGLLGAGYWLSRGRAVGDQGRLSLWRGAVDMLQEAPLTGVGVYQFGATWRAEHSLSASTDHLKTAHNLYLNTAAEIGLVGLVILAWATWAFLWAWWRQWSSASPPQRLRLVGVLAALVGFAAQSAVDTFTYTSTLLPAFVAIAYVLYGQPATLPKPSQWHRWARGVALAGLMIFSVWLARVDVAKVRLLQSIAAIGSEDYPQALRYLDQAEALDPDLRLYDLQRAYVLGYLADENPDEYLQPAIEQYRALQASDPSFYVGQINLAALYAQAGDWPAAQATLEAALPIRSDLALVRLQLGRVAEAQGQDETALRWYQAALDPASPWVGSGFWRSTPLRQQAWEAQYASLDAATQTLWAVDQERAREAAEAVTRIGTPQTYLEQNALAYYAAWQGDFPTAIQWYEDSLAALPMQPWTAAQLAAAYYSAGDLEQAEQQAHLALFLTQYADPFQRINQVAYVRGGSAAYVLAQLAIQEDSATDQQINDWLFQAVETTPLYQSYEDVVFSQAAYLPYLPQVEVLGGNERTYAPWVLLAQRFESDEDPQTDPADVDKALQAADPYLVGGR